MLKKDKRGGLVGLKQEGVTSRATPSRNRALEPGAQYLLQVKPISVYGPTCVTLLCSEVS